LYSFYEISEFPNKYSTLERQAIKGKEEGYYSKRKEEVGWNGSPGGAHVSTDTSLALTGVVTWELMHPRRFRREGRDAIAKPKGRRRNRIGRRNLVSR
jgi:hypothetical protein